MTAVVEADAVTYAYGETVAVQDISMTVAEGGFLGLIGPNGSGKTTLLHLLLGLKTPDTGTVRLFGEPADAFDDGNRIGYVSQRATDRGETMPVSVREAVLMGRFSLIGHRRVTQTDYDRVTDALERVGIAELADRRISTLSGGQRQRTFIARALAKDADLLVLDEPTVGVDIESRSAFYELLGALNDDGITIILVEHDIETVTTHADQLVCIDRTLQYNGDAHAFLDTETLSDVYGDTGRLLYHDH